MQTVIIKAQDVRVGDEVFNLRVNHPAYRWQRVRAIIKTKVAAQLEGGGTGLVDGFEFDCGYLFSACHNEDICVRRPILSTTKEDLPTAALVEDCFKRLLDAARTLLSNAADRGECFIDDDEEPEFDDYPVDEEGTRWYPDWFELQAAVATCEKAKESK
jgi:hypothetical protein